MLELELYLKLTRQKALPNYGWYPLPERFLCTSRSAILEIHQRNRT
jgi:hypothetical protein